jgi:MFS family permease
MFPIVFAIFATPIGSLSDKVSRRIVVSLGYALFGIICIGFIFASSLVGFMVLFALYGLFWATTHAMQRAFTVDLVGDDKRGTALGVYHSVAGVLALPSNLIAGYLWTAFGAPGTATFLFGAVFAFISAVLLFFLLKK